MDAFTRSEIESSIHRIEELLGCGIFAPENSNHVLLHSAFIELLICMRDLMAKVEKFSGRISFADDVKVTDNIKDVTDLIKFIRDAVCHSHVYNHFAVPRKARASFMVAYGKYNILQLDDINIASDYADDVCFFFGEQKIYLSRHIIRAFTEATQKLIPLL